MTKHVTFTLICIAALTLLSQAVSAQQYNVTNINSAPNPNSGVWRVTNINDLGEAVGNVHGQGHFVWRPSGSKGGISFIPSAYAINDINLHGLAVGTTNSSPQQAFVMDRDNTITILPLGGCDVRGKSVSNTNQVFGERRTGTNCSVTEAFMYDLDTGVYQNLTNPAYPLAMVFGGSENGQHLTGSTLSGLNHGAQAFLWTSGIGLGIISYYGPDIGMRVNNHGDIMGQWNYPGQGQKAGIFYQSGGLGFLGSVNASGNLDLVLEGRDLNDSKQAVGSALMHSSNDTRALYWANPKHSNTTVQLDQHLNHANTWHLGLATAINNRGQIAAVGGDMTANTGNLVLLTPDNLRIRSCVTPDGTCFNGVPLASCRAAGGSDSLPNICVEHHNNDNNNSHFQAGGL